MSCRLGRCRFFLGSERVAVAEADAALEAVPAAAETVCSLAPTTWAFRRQPSLPSPPRGERLVAGAVVVAVVAVANGVAVAVADAAGLAVFVGLRGRSRRGVSTIP